MMETSKGWTLVDAAVRKYLSRDPRGSSHYAKVWPALLFETGQGESVVLSLQLFQEALRSEPDCAQWQGLKKKVVSRLKVLGPLGLNWPFKKDAKQWGRRTKWESPVGPVNVECVRFSLHKRMFRAHLKMRAGGRTFQLLLQQGEVRESSNFKECCDWCLERSCMTLCEAKSGLDWLKGLPVEMPKGLEARFKEVVRSLYSGEEQFWLF